MACSVGQPIGNNGCLSPPGTLGTLVVAGPRSLRRELKVLRYSPTDLQPNPSGLKPGCRLAQEDAHELASA